MVEKATSIQDEMLRLLLHDVRSLNHIVLANVEQAQKNLPRESPVSGFVAAAFHSAELLAARLALVDLELNPSVFLSGNARTVRIYEKFDKATKILKRKAKERGLRMTFEGGSQLTIDCYPHFDLLPFLLLENATKYSLKSYPISLTFVENVSGLEVVIESFGPHLPDSEFERVFEKGYRGANAVKASSDGQGMGLFLAKSIADFHEVHLSVRSAAPKTEVSGVPYSDFCVRCTFTRQP